MPTDIRSDMMRFVGNSFVVAVEDGARKEIAAHLRDIEAGLRSLSGPLQRRQNEGSEPVYDLAASFNSNMTLAYRASRVCEDLIGYYRDFFLAHQSSLVPMMSIRHLIEPGVVHNLFNAKRLLTGDNAGVILDDQMRQRVGEIFDAHIPNLHRARDALAHEHDRNVGRFRSQIIAKYGQSPASRVNGIAGLIDSQGVEFEFNFSAASQRTLLGDIAGLLKN